MSVFLVYFNKLAVCKVLIRYDGCKVFLFRNTEIKNMMVLPQFYALFRLGIMSWHRHVARNLLWGGVFWILEKTSNYLDVDINRSLISFSDQNQVVSKKKKKIFTQIQSVFLTNFS